MTGPRVPVLLDLLVGYAGDDSPGARPLTLAQADSIAGLAQEVGVAALRLLDHTPGVHVLDPTVVGSHLAGLHGEIGYLADVPTTGNAPYNLARRVLSVDRATAGRFGVTLRVGDGDEVSDAATPDPGAADQTRRWAEYAEVLTRLWESFPRRALIGDQERALVVDDTLIRPIGHTGRFYRVAGPLDGPSSVQGRPVLVAADPDVLDFPAVAPWVDAVIVDRTRLPGAETALSAALRQAGRARGEVVLLGRTGLPDIGGTGNGGLAAGITAWVAEAGLDGVVLAPGDADQTVALLADLAPALAASAGGTLRSRLGLRASAEVAA